MVETSVKFQVQFIGIKSIMFESLLKNEKKIGIELQK